MVACVSRLSKSPFLFIFITLFGIWSERPAPGGGLQVFWSFLHCVSYAKGTYITIAQGLRNMGFFVSFLKSALYKQTSLATHIHFHGGFFVSFTMEGTVYWGEKFIH